MDLRKNLDLPVDHMVGMKNHVSWMAQKVVDESNISTDSSQRAISDLGLTPRLKAVASFFITIRSLAFTETTVSAT